MANPVAFTQDYISKLESLRSENASLQSHVQILDQKRKDSEKQNDSMQVSIHEWHLDL